MIYVSSNSSFWKANHIFSPAYLFILLLFILFLSLSLSLLSPPLGNARNHVCTFAAESAALFVCVSIFCLITSSTTGDTSVFRFWLPTADINWLCLCSGGGGCAQCYQCVYCNLQFEAVESWGRYCPEQNIRKKRGWRKELIPPPPPPPHPLLLITTKKCEWTSVRQSVCYHHLLKTAKNASAGKFSLFLLFFLHSSD